VTPTTHSTPSVAYLGPNGTFTEQALLTQPDLAAADLRLLPSISEVLAATQTGEVDLGFAAIENSIEGTVNVTLDALAFEANLLIQREVVIGVQLNLLASPGTEIGDNRPEVSFPHAAAQCRGFLRRRLPEATPSASNSTADAARWVAENGDPSCAAVGTALAGELYGLETLAADIEDHPENETRFVVVAGGGVPAATGHDKTSIVIFQRADRPGSLLSILQEFAARSINLTKLESRPTKQALGDYCFIIDLEGHIADELIADCLKNIRAKQADVKFLGSYPAAGDAGHEVRADASAAWREAEAWLDSLRAQIGGEGGI
jgi:prephenate dehydratase